MSGEKKYPASARKLLKARKDGDVAKSRDFTSSMVFISQLACLFSLSDCFMGILNFSEKVFRDAPNVDIYAVEMLVREGCGLVCSLAIPCLLTGVLVGVFVEFLQVGFYFLASNLALKVSRLNVISGFKRLCGIEESGLSLLLPYRFGKMCIVLILTVILFWTNFVDFSHNFISYEVMTGSHILIELKKESFYFIFTCCAILLAIGAVDLFHERYRRSSRLMMDAEELKQEYKDAEGEPHMKHARKQVQQEMSEYARVSDVRKAKVVITDEKSV